MLERKNTSQTFVRNSRFKFQKLKTYWRVKIWHFVYWSTKTSIFQKPFTIEKQLLSHSKEKGTLYSRTKQSIRFSKIKSVTPCQTWNKVTAINIWLLTHWSIEMSISQKVFKIEKQLPAHSMKNGTVYNRSRQSFEFLKIKNGTTTEVTRSKFDT